MTNEIVCGAGEWKLTVLDEVKADTSDNRHFVDGHGT